MARMRRTLAGLLLLLCLTLIGFVAGVELSATFLLRPGAGLAGAATVTVSAVIGALLGVVGGVVIIARTDPDRLSGRILPAFLAGVAALGLLVIRTRNRRAAREATARAEQATLGPDGRPLPPALPVPGTLDSLQGLVVMPAESLPRFETREHGYEEVSVTVYRRQDEWYLVGLSDGGRAWVSERRIGAYYPFSELIVNRLNYLTKGWDSLVRSAPSLEAPATPVPFVNREDDEVPANVVETSQAGGTLWLRVEVWDRSPCEGEDPRVIATGWIPAWAPNGKPTAWFYSRGC
jgi:hypothetical protein